MYSRSRFCIVEELWCHVANESKIVYCTLIINIMLLHVSV